MLIPIGFFGAGAAAGAYELIETQVLGSDVYSITFSSVPQTYKHLQIRLTARCTASGSTGDWLSIRFNGDSSGNYGGSYYLIGNLG